MLAIGPRAAVLWVLLLPSCSRAAVVNATPADFAARLANARPGDTIVLAPGTYDNVAIIGRSYAPSLTINAAAATLVEARVGKSKGVTIRGGSYRLGAPRTNRKTGGDVFGAGIRIDNAEDVKILDGRFVGPSAGDKPQTEFGEGYGVRVIGGRGIEVINGRFEGFKSGIAMTRIDGFRLAGNVFSGMRADGLSVSLSYNGIIEKNECRANRVRDKEHPDCIQLWSRPTAPPTSDVMIRENLIEGSTQGIGLHNHVRKGINDGGFDRITIENNIVRVSRPNAISLQNARESVIRNNKVSTYPGARFRASIRSSGPSVTVCGNTVEPGAGKSGVKDKAC